MEILKNIKKFITSNWDGLIIIAVSVLFCAGLITFYIEGRKREKAREAIASTPGSLYRNPIELIITLYSHDGTIIQQWEGTYRVRINGEVVSFVDNGKEVRISGIWTIIEKQ